MNHGSPLFPTILVKLYENMKLHINNKYIFHIDIVYIHINYVYI